MQILSNDRQYSQSIQIAEKLHDPDNPDLGHLNCLVVCHDALGEREKVLRFCIEKLQLLDRLAMGGNAQENTERPAASASKVHPVMVFSYSLWGASPIYNYGAMINARLAPIIYPGSWTRFYIDDTVPQFVRNELRVAGAEVIRADQVFPAIPRYFWRFLAADDDTDDYFCCRDCDCRPSTKEAAAVEVWLDSGLSYHVMRDGVVHTDLILAGLWGGRRLRDLNMTALIRTFFAGGINQTYGFDQRFLRQKVWPLIKDHSLIHDTYYDLFGAQRFPLFKREIKIFLVGGGVTSNKLLCADVARFGLPWPPPF